MANTKTTTKKTKVQSKSKKKVIPKKNNNKKNKGMNKGVLALICVLIIILVIIIVVIKSNNKHISCSKTVSESGFKIDSKVTINMKKNNISKIVTVKKVSLLEESKDINYLSMVKRSFEDLYKDLNMDYSIEETDSELVVTVNYTDKKEYILDNVFLEKADDGISFNVIREDAYQNYATFDLSKNYTTDKVTKTLASANYECK